MSVLSNDCSICCRLYTTFFLYQKSQVLFWHFIHSKSNLELKIYENRHTWAEDSLQIGHSADVTLSKYPKRTDHKSRPSLVISIWDSVWLVIGWWRPASWRLVICHLSHQQAPLFLLDQTFHMWISLSAYIITFILPFNALCRSFTSKMFSIHGNLNISSDITREFWHVFL